MLYFYQYQEYETRKIYIKAISSKFDKRKINKDFIEGDFSESSEDNNNGKSC